MKKLDEQAERSRDNMERLQARAEQDRQERREFHERLLSVLEHQNELLVHILRRERQAD